NKENSDASERNAQCAPIPVLVVPVYKLLMRTIALRTIAPEMRNVSKIGGRTIKGKVTCRRKEATETFWRPEIGEEFKAASAICENFSCKENSPLKSECPTDDPNCEKISAKNDNTTTECSGETKIAVKPESGSYYKAYPSHKLTCDKIKEVWKIDGLETEIVKDDNVVCKKFDCTLPKIEDCDAQALDSYLCGKVDGVVTDGENKPPSDGALFVYKHNGQEYTGDKLVCHKEKEEWTLSGGTEGENKFDGKEGSLFVRYKNCTAIQTVCAD
ncbi:hypothetical protein PMAYCL1PPCAC_30953, partial [Pristionchus mayeri]